MPATLNAITETYLDVEKLIHATVWRFYRQHGGDVEELLSIAHERFAESYHGYDGDKGQFTTWLTTSIWWGLKQSQRQDAHKRVYPDLNRLPARRIAPEIEAVLGELSEECRMVALLAINPPEDVKFTARCGRGEDKPASIRHGIKHYLRDMGWTNERVHTVFATIREALI